MQMVLANRALTQLLEHNIGSRGPVRKAVPLSHSGYDPGGSRLILIETFNPTLTAVHLCPGVWRSMVKSQLQCNLPVSIKGLCVYKLQANLYVNASQKQMESLLNGMPVPLVLGT